MLYIFNSQIFILTTIIQLRIYSKEVVSIESESARYSYTNNKVACPCENSHLF